MPSLDRPLTRSLQALFFAALAVVLVVTLIPMPPPKVANGDKVEHFVAFYGLTLLGAAAYRRNSLAPLALALSAYGGLIELLQGLPFIERSTDVTDWMADSIGVLIAITPILLASWRNRASA